MVRKRDILRRLTEKCGSTPKSGAGFWFLVLGFQGGSGVQGFRGSGVGGSGVGVQGSAIGVWGLGEFTGFFTGHEPKRIEFNRILFKLSNQEIDQDDVE